MAVNVWCASSPGLLAYNAAKAKVPPIGANWPFPMQILATKMYIEALLKALGHEQPGETVRKFIIERQFDPGSSLWRTMKTCFVDWKVI